MFQLFQLFFFIKSFIAPKGIGMYILIVLGVIAIHDFEIHGLFKDNFFQKFIEF